LYEKIGFFGLGTMGIHMTSNLVKAKYKVYAYDPNQDTIKKLFIKNEITWCKSAVEVANNVNIIILCLPTFDDVIKTIEDVRNIVNKKSGSVLIDMSTSPPRDTKEVASDLARDNIHFMDAPISGGPQRAKTGELSIFIGGEKEIFERNKHIFNVIGKNIFYMGDSGNGQLMKLVNNLVSLTNLLVLAEALNMGANAGLSVAQMVKAINVSGGVSRMSQERGPRIAKRDFSLNDGGKLEHAYKDLRFVCDFADSTYTPLPLANFGKQVYQLANHLNLGKDELASIIKIYEYLNNRHKW